MLILTRKIDESIIIDGNIEIKVVELDNGRVKIGIEAPRDIEIMRKELYEKTQEENRAAVNTKLNPGDMKRLLKK